MLVIDGVKHHSKTIHG